MNDIKDKLIDRSLAIFGTNKLIEKRRRYYLRTMYEALKQENYSHEDAVSKIVTDLYEDGIRPMTRDQVEEMIKK